MPSRQTLALLLLLGLVACQSPATQEQPAPPTQPAAVAPLRALPKSSIQPSTGSAGVAATPGRTVNIQLNFKQLLETGFRVKQADPFAGISFVTISIRDLSGQQVAGTDTPVAVNAGSLSLNFNIPGNESYYLVTLQPLDDQKQPVGSVFKGFFRCGGQGAANPAVQLSWLSTPVAETLEYLAQLQPDLIKARLVNQLEARIGQFMISPGTRNLAKFPSALDAQALANEIKQAGQMPDQINPAYYKPGKVELRVKGMFYARAMSFEVPMLGLQKNFTGNGKPSLDLPPGRWAIKLNMPATEDFYGLLQSPVVSISQGQTNSQQLVMVYSPFTNRITQSKIELGYRLFFEPRLSGNNQMSCATCHDPKKGFSNGEATAQGITGERGNRNVPTLYTMNQFSSFFLDGRAPTLEAQALMPIQNPIEMNETLPNVVSKLSAIPYYPEKFQQAFGTGVTSTGIADALASFERILSLYDGVYEQRLEPGNTTFTAQMQRGLDLFNNKARCNLCHQPDFFTNFSYHNIGVGVNAPNPDTGRFAVTNQPADWGKFKNTTLRNITKTGPYLHDGSSATLEEVIEYYNTGGNANANLDPLMQALNLTAEEKADLLSFLQSLDAPDNMSVIARLPGIRQPGEVVPFLPD